MDTIRLLLDNYPVVAAGLVTGTAAFVGVLVGILGNGCLQRRERKAAQKHEHTVLRSAMLAELSFLLREYRYRVGKMETALAEFYVPTITATQIFDKIPERLGLLTAMEGGTVFHAYISAKHLAPNLRRIALETALLAEPQITDDYIGVAKHNMPLAIAMHRQRIELFKKAIRSLGGIEEDEPGDQDNASTGPVSPSAGVGCVPIMRPKHRASCTSTAYVPDSRNRS